MEMSHFLFKYLDKLFILSSLAMHRERAAETEVTEHNQEDFNPAGYVG